MKLHHFFVLVFVVGLLTSCEDDSEIRATIVGTWQADRADLNVRPDGFLVGIPYALDDFDAVIEFKPNGTVTIINENTTTGGTYEMEGDQLALNSNFMVEDIDMSGTYTVKKLTLTVLEMEIEKDATVKNPNNGTDISGRVKATFYFNKQ